MMNQKEKKKQQIILKRENIYNRVYLTIQK